MKTKILILLLLLAAVCGACHRSSHRDAQAFYDRYAVRENLTVIYVGGYSRDSIHGDFVILEAQDTATWFALAKEFGIPRCFAQITDSTKKKAYITSYENRKDPTQEVPTITSESGKQIADVARSCIRVVDIIGQKMFFIFAEDEESMVQIEFQITHSITDNS